MSIAKTTIRTSLLICVTALMAACSQDKHFYYSSVERPTNVSVYDPFADKPLWVKEIPVGQTLELDFDRKGEKEWQKVKLKPATELTWKLYQNDTKSDPIASDTVAMPGTPIIIKVSYRPSPEYPAN